MNENLKGGKLYSIDLQWKLKYLSSPPQKKKPPLFGKGCCTTSSTIRKRISEGSMKKRDSLTSSESWEE
jgi:hypothetical protein